jgi:serine/threonine protein kinase
MDRVLEQFDAVSVVTTGTQGAAAWIAREPGSDDTVLIKRLPDDTLRTRATLALALHHPGIAKTTKWLYDESSFYVVRKFVAGHSLRHAADQSRISSFSSLKATLDVVLNSLEALHGSGAAHGGISPENIIVDADGSPIITDFATVSGTHSHFVPAEVLGRHPTAKADFYALCELYKEFLPVRPPDDGDGNAARERLIKNLTEVQQTCRTATELRYKLDAIANMANLMGFNASSGERDTIGQWHCARLSCTVTPSTASVSPGGVSAIVVSVENSGNIPLVIDSVGSDVVWLNPIGKASRLTLAPDAGAAIPFTLSGARLLPGDYTARIIVRSNHEMSTMEPPDGVPWHEHFAALPVMVRGAKESSQPPLAESLPDPAAANQQEENILAAPPSPNLAPGKRPSALPEALPRVEPGTDAKASGNGGFSVQQNPDPVVLKQGDVGVLHVSVVYNGGRKARIDRVSTWPPWLVYPGEFKPAMLTPGATASIGFSVISPALTPGDYTAEATLITSELIEHEVGAQTEWQEVKCPIRVRILRAEGAPQIKNAGCAPIIIGVITLLATGSVLYHLKL